MDRMDAHLNRAFAPKQSSTNPATAAGRNRGANWTDVERTQAKKEDAEIDLLRQKRTSELSARAPG